MDIVYRVKAGIAYYAPSRFVRNKKVSRWLTTFLIED